VGGRDVSSSTPVYCCADTQKCPRRAEKIVTFIEFAVLSHPRECHHP